jgi:hypothetical protein
MHARCSASALSRTRRSGRICSREEGFGARTGCFQCGTRTGIGANARKCHPRGLSDHGGACRALRAHPLHALVARRAPRSLREFARGLPVLWWLPRRSRSARRWRTLAPLPQIVDHRTDHRQRRAPLERRAQPRAHAQAVRARRGVFCAGDLIQEAPRAARR